MSLLDRVPRTPLVTRLLAAITAVLALSFVVTYLVESNLTRSALRAQAESVLDQRAHQARQVLARDIESIIAELQYVNSVYRRTTLPEPPVAAAVSLSDILEDVADRRPFTVIGVYDDHGEPLLKVAGPQLVGPPPTVFDRDTASFAGRVVEAVDGSRAYVAGELLDVGSDQILVVLGYVFDAAYARSVRDTAGSDAFVLEADGQVVASSLPERPGQDLDNVGFDARIPVVEVGGHTYWGSFQPFSDPPDEWGVPARFGVLIDEPLARLDAQLFRNRLGAGAALLVIATGLAWVVSRRMTKPLRQLTATAARIASGDRDAEFPVTSEDEVGVLARALEEMRRGLRHQLELIQRQAEALRDAGGRLVHAQDEARRRMAGDLHDGVQRQLVMLRLHIGFGRERIRRAPEEADRVLDELSEEIDQVLGRLRETAQGIYPAILRDRGLEGALFSLGARSRLPVEIEVEPEPLPRLAYDIEANTYFLASEAVTNAIKHARATHVGVTVRVDDDVLLLTVRDDGHGFDLGSEARGRGLGNMQDRARALGGLVEIATGTGGTVVTARLPLDGSVAGALQEEQDRGDAAVDVHVLTQPELLEDGVDVLLDGPFGDRQVPGDAAVALPHRHEGQDVQFPRGEPGQS